MNKIKLNSYHDGVVVEVCEANVWSAVTTVRVFVPLALWHTMFGSMANTAGRVPVNTGHYKNEWRL